MTDGTGRRARVITASDRAAAGLYEDRSGPLAADALRDLGFTVDAPVVVPDGEAVHEALVAAIADGVDVVLTTGGTGLGPRDLTPEMTEPLLERQLPALAAAVARVGFDKGVPASLLSRGLAGIAGRTFIANLPGSVGGVRDGMTILGAVLPHALDVLDGGGHG